MIEGLRNGQLRNSKSGVYLHKGNHMVSLLKCEFLSVDHQLRVSKYIVSKDLPDLLTLSRTKRAPRRTPLRLRLPFDRIYVRRVESRLVDLL